MTKWIRWTGVGFLALALVNPAMTATAHDNGIDEARKAARLVEQGQLALKEAISMAEVHTKGTAISAKVIIKSPVAEVPKSDRKPGDPSAAQQPAGDRLMYEVTCLVSENVQIVHMDGLTKRVVAVTEPKPERVEK